MLLLQKRVIMWGMEISNLMVVITRQYVCVSKHQVVHLKLTHVYVSKISIKLGEGKNVTYL